MRKHSTESLAFGRSIRGEKYRPSSRSARRQQGVVLPITLVLLLVLITAGAVAARNSAVSEQVSNNVRTSNVAFQAAEIGLRYCEDLAINIFEGGSGFPADVVSKVPATTTTIASPENSTAKTLANWTSSAISVADNYYKKANTTVNTSIQLTHAPTCIVERLPATYNNRFLITARGKSNDAKTDSSGRLTVGSEVWLQSTLKQPS